MNAMHRTLALFVFLLCWTAYSPSMRAQAPPQDAQHILASLWQYYDAADSSGIHRYFTHWVVDAAERYEASDSVRQILNGLFRTWFQKYYDEPPAPGERRAKQHQFLVFHDRLAFAEHRHREVFEKSLSEIRSPVDPEWLTGFRPEDPLKRHAVLIMPEQLSDALTSFLNGYRELRLPLPTELLSDETDRLEFIRKFFPIGIAHWGAYYHFASLPHWYRVDLSPDHCEARIEYKDSYHSGSIFILRREGNTWVRVHTDPAPIWLE